MTDGEDWVTYRRLPDGKGEIRRMARDGTTRVRTLPAGPADNFVLGIDAGGTKTVCLLADADGNPAPSTVFGRPGWA